MLDLVLVRSGEMGQHGPVLVSYNDTAFAGWHLRINPVFNMETCICQVGVVEGHGFSSFLADLPLRISPSKYLHIRRPLRSRCTRLNWGRGYTVHLGQCSEQHPRG